VRARQREIEQHESAVGVARERRQRFIAIDGRENLEHAMELRQRMRERLLDEWMVVDNEYRYKLKKVIQS